MLCIKNADLQAASFGQRRDDELRQQALLDERLDDSMLPCYRTALNDLYIEWTYTIDLDREVFSIDNGAHFKLNKIPRDDWIEALALDDNNGRLVLPHLVPADSLASLTSQSKEPGHSSKSSSVAYEKLVPQLVGTLMPPQRVSDQSSMHSSRRYEKLIFLQVRPKGYTDFDPVICHGPAILSNLWLIFRSKLEGEMPYVLLGLSPDDFAFREIAFAIVSLAAGLTDSLTFVDARRLRGDLRDGYLGIVHGNDSSGLAHFAAELGLGCHMDGSQPGSAPAASSYWFGGVLIRLECQLDRPAAVQQAIVLAVECGRRESQEPNFDAILLSIEHAVILRVFPDHIEHTELLSLLEIPIHYTKTPLDRYPLEVRCEIEGWQEETQLEIPAEVYDPTGNQGSSATSDESDPSTTNHEPCTFMALIHCFEATTVRSLSRASANDGRLPAELYETILDYVNDETYWACSKVSRHFRRHCLKHLRFIKDAVVRRGHFPTTAQTPKTQDSSIATLTFDLFDEITESTVPSQMKRGLLSDVRISSYGLRRNQEKQETVWQVLVGRSPRLSLLVCFIFSNFHAQLHWQASAATVDPVISRRRRISLSLNERDQEQHWTNPQMETYVNVPTLSCKAVFHIWEAILPSYKLNLSPIDPAWAFPPNTQYGYVRSWDITREGAQNFRWFMYLVAKRASATTQRSEVWERATKEAEMEVDTVLPNREERLTAYRFASRLHCRTVRECRSSLLLSFLRSCLDGTNKSAH